MNPYKEADLRAFIESCSDEELDCVMKMQEEANEREYKAFHEALAIGVCYICGQPMNSCEKTAPCFHWFTYPEGIKKKYFTEYLKQQIGFFRIDCYFRWLANSETPLGNINDLHEEISAASFVETTIKYKNIEWAFSIGNTDKEGHKGTQTGEAPHFHIQMKVNGNVFIKFNDFHIPFSSEDLFKLEMMEQAGDLVLVQPYKGEGMGILEQEDGLEIIDGMEELLTDDVENATLRRQTIIIGQGGKGIPSDLIEKAMQESNKTREPIGRIITRMIEDTNVEANVTAVISPGEGVPEMAKRSGKK